jgi:hypothetical protein
MTTTNYDEMIPEGILFSIRQIDEMNLIKSDMLKKLIYNGAIEIVKIGSKNFVSRIALIKFLDANTVAASN